MLPTREQQEIIDTELQIGESLIVDSGAGTGKTSCFIEVSRVRPQAKLLYICFNNKGAAEARERYRKEGIRNTISSTIHGLAKQTKAIYEQCGKFQTKISSKEIQNRAGCSSEEAWRIQTTLKNFCESADPFPSKEHVPADPRTKKEAAAETLKAATQIWGAMINPEDPFPISYDQYLKVYQLTGPKLSFDYILLDEAQDSNPLSLNILERQIPTARIILIGDENQAIYSWRGAKNAMASWPTPNRKSLTESFRFGREIATTANILLKNFQKRGKPLKGHKPQDSVGPLPQSLPFTLIARTNGTLFEKAIESNRLQKKFHFVGTKEAANWDPTIPYKFDDAKDVYRLWIGDRKGIKNPQIRIFESYAELKKAATGSETLTDTTQNHGDKELESLCRIVEKYTHRLPLIIDEIVRNCVSPDDADILLATAHRAKGLEWPRVKLADDFCPLVLYRKEDDPPEIPEIRIATVLDEKNPKGDIPLEEFNLVYVAVTRALERLELNPKFQDLLDNPQLLAPETELPVQTPVFAYTPEPVPPKTARNPHSLQIPFDRKEQAKTIANAAGGRLLWKTESRSWHWSHPQNLPPPQALHALTSSPRHSLRGFPDIRHLAQSAIAPEPGRFTLRRAPQGDAKHLPV